MNPILEFPLELFAKWKTQQFTQKTEQTAAVQEAFLLALLKDHQNTQFGKKYNFSEINSVEAFRKQIPIFTYQDYRPYMEQIANGKPNVLTADTVIYINMTSGSTGKQKLIPVTKQAHRVRSQANLGSAE
jgi:phenylacetate-coenzyme A ligase PaaK-like adenylate-forming protein